MSHNPLKLLTNYINSIRFNDDLKYILGYKYQHTVVWRTDCKEEILCFLRILFKYTGVKQLKILHHLSQEAHLCQLHNRTLQISFDSFNTILPLRFYWLSLYNQCLKKNFQNSFGKRDELSQQNDKDIIVIIVFHATSAN